MSEVEIAKMIFEKIEASDFEGAKDFLGSGFEFSGPVPEPVDAEGWLAMQEKLLTAFPDWRFNLEDLQAEADKVHCTVAITGTHKGALDMSDLGLPTIPATGKSVSLPREKVEVTFAGDKITSVRSPGSADAGVKGILSQLGVEMPV
jgi:predicted ester cyclase